MKQKPNTLLRKKRAPKPCLFCVEKKNPDYKDVDTLVQFVSDRAKLMGPDRTGVCASHQRKLAEAVKRARHLALLPFAGSL